MERRTIAERPDWQRQATAVGFDFAIIDGERYWDERVFYAFTLAQIEEHIEAPTQELLGLCYQAVDYVIKKPELLRRFAIPETAWDYLRRSWQRQDRDLYGRFDFHYDGSGPPKLFEFNADTPTALFEAAVFQWHWLEECIASGALPADADQFNSIHDKLIEAFGKFGIGRRTLHFACMREDPEDKLTVDYLEDCARQAGLRTAALAMADIGITAAGHFTDLADTEITAMFKLYPWEWLLAETFGQYLPGDSMQVIEPVWKMVLANKGLLAVLWEMFPEHPLLLPCYFEDDARAASLGPSHVRKPLLGREGANVELVSGGRTQRSDGPYGEEGYVVQALCEIPDFAGNRPVIGSWIVAGQACGMGIREDESAITGNLARFVPHAIVG